jgi:DNA-directed RNA polymerase subunit M/transcription elongation factor TFIIS
MRCRECDKDFPSKYYFITDSLCHTCFEKLDEKEKKSIIDGIESLTREEASIRNVDGHPLKCPVCGHKEFNKRKTLMNTPGLTFFGLEWANREAVNFVCNSCGYIMWFLRDDH